MTYDSLTHYDTAPTLPPCPSFIVRNSKTDAKENLEEVGASHLLQDRPVRHLLLAFVKTHIVRGMLPFNFMEDEKRRNFYQLMNKELPVEKLNNQGVGRVVKMSCCFCSVVVKRSSINIWQSLL